MNDKKNIHVHYKNIWKIVSTMTNLYNFNMSFNLGSTIAA